MNPEETLRSFGLIGSDGWVECEFGELITAFNAYAQAIADEYFAKQKEAPDPFLQYLDSEIERYNKLRYLSEDEVSKFQFLGSASSLIDAKEKYSQLHADGK